MLGEILNFYEQKHAIILLIIVIVVGMANIALLIVLIFSKKNRTLRDTEEFISSVSHDLRTPLNAICGYTEILQYDNTLSTKSKGQVKIINDSANMMVNLINEILDHSRVKSGKLSIYNESFNILSKIQSINDIHMVSAASKNIAFDVKIQNIKPNDVMFGDSLRITQVLNNIISNAIKFTVSGGVYVRIYKQERFLNIKVTDTGKGMTHTELKRIFKKFTQASFSTFKYHGGSGLGLFITKDLIRLMHGTIDVNSEKDKGTEVKIKLPLN